MANLNFELINQDSERREKLYVLTSMYFSRRGIAVGQFFSLAIVEREKHVWNNLRVQKWVAGVRQLNHSLSSVSKWVSHLEQNMLFLVKWNHVHNFGVKVLEEAEATLELSLFLFAAKNKTIIVTFLLARVRVLRVQSWRLMQGSGC